MKTKQVKYKPDDPILVFRAALVVRRQMLVDQQEIVRRHPATFSTPVIQQGLKVNEQQLTRLTLNLKRIYDGEPIPLQKRRTILTRLDAAIVRLQRSLNRQRVLIAQRRGRYVMRAVKEALARYDDLDVSHPERTFDLTVTFGNAPIS